MPPKFSAFVSRATIQAIEKPLADASAKRLALSDGDVRGDRSNSFSEKSFRRILCQERKRSERSRKPFLLMLVRAKSLSVQNASVQPLLERILEVLGTNLRETDTLGWFEAKLSVGVIFSELGDTGIGSAVKSIQAKTIAALAEAVGAQQVTGLEITFYAFPDDRSEDRSLLAVDPAIYSDLSDLDGGKKTFLVIKRIMDAFGSACALIFLAPLFLALAGLIKLTSRGPVFYRQERLGQFEKPFIFLKFRSMRVSTDPQIHREYVRNFIAGRAQPNAAKGSHRRVYKITNDPRITSIGKLMRRTSLDELPQFWNVLMGHMSLVGPRPPIRYELEAYDVWHRRRLWDAKPGITGLWQVCGRSRTTFDDMVRLDLRYSKTWSLMSDIKILLRTPRAVFSGDGAL
jgi:lipopolysaccharide/colanic/teichoic acid biosynthesis glycosyltransferase